MREEAGDAMEFYAERFRSFFRDAGDNLTKAGSQVGGTDRTGRRLAPQPGWRPRRRQRGQRRRQLAVVPS